jgi:hypothetical protein
VHGLSAFTFAFCCLAITLTGCATLFPSRSTDFAVGSGEYAIAIEGDGSTDRATLMRDFHRRALEICRGKYSFRSEMNSDEFGPSMTGYVHCEREPRRTDPSREQAAAAVSSRVVKKDGQDCLQGIDAEGSVVVEDCQPVKGGR